MRLVLSLVLLVACDDTPADTPPPEPQGGYSIHEWGFLAHHFADGRETTRYVGATPGRFPTGPAGPQDLDLQIESLGGLELRGGKPILYVHLDEGVDSLDFQATVTLASEGTFDEHLPPAQLNGSSLRWNVTARPGTCSALARYPTASDPRCTEPSDGYCEAAELGMYETNDGACLNVGGGDWNHLFYRAQAPGVMPVRIESTHEGQLIHNDGSTVLPSKLIRIRRHATASQTRVHVFDAPAPGQSIPLPDATEMPAGEASQQLRAVLGNLGMTTDETNAFMRAWESELLGTAPFAGRPAAVQVGTPPRELRPKDDALVYFMAQADVDALVRLEFDPTPREVRRALLVRIDLNPHPEGTIGLGNLGTIIPSYGQTRAPVVQIRSAELEIEGALPREVVQRILRRYVGEIRSCYEAADSDAEGTMTYRLVIDAAGSVSNATLGDNELGADVGRCVVGAARGWTFARPERGVLRVSQTLRFSKP